MTAVEVPDSEPPSLSVEDMTRLIERAFGARGRYLVDCWAAYNSAFFANALTPVPVMLLWSSGSRLQTGQTQYGRGFTFNIQIKRALSPKHARTALLHQMVHQNLVEHGLDPKHSGRPWRDEIERLSRLVFRVHVRAAGSRVVKVRDADGGRISQRTGPDTSHANVLNDDQIGHWPHAGFLPRGAEGPDQAAPFGHAPDPDHMPPTGAAPGDADLHTLDGSRGAQMIPERLARVMREHGLTNRGVAQATGLSSPTITNIKNGRHGTGRISRAALEAYLKRLE
jgi:hypothetical protein